MKQLGRCGLICKKLGMSQIFMSNGRLVPVTLLYVETNHVVGIKNYHHGLGIQVAAFDAKKHRVSKSIQGLFRPLNISDKKVIKEFRVNSTNQEKLGNTLSINHFKIGQYIDVSAKTIGKGYAGVMKRHNFKGLEASHGVSISHRSAGSTGQCQDPGKVFKGKKMAGRLGGKMRTKQNVKIVDMEKEMNILVIQGSVPGSVNNYLYIKDAIKKIINK